MSRREVCHCGHDISSHYFDPASKKREGCLCRGCLCRRYVHEDDPKSTQQIPAAKPVVRTAPEDVDTLPMFPAAAPSSHGTDCQCFDCTADRLFGSGFPKGWP